MVSLSRYEEVFSVLGVSLDRSIGIGVLFVAAGFLKELRSMFSGVLSAGASDRGDEILIGVLSTLPVEIDCLITTGSTIGLSPPSDLSDEGFRLLGPGHQPSALEDIQQF
jgi:hypothetical protein